MEGKTAVEKASEEKLKALGSRMTDWAVGLLGHMSNFVIGFLLNLSFFLYIFFYKE